MCFTSDTNIQFRYIVAKCPKSPAGIYKSWVALKVMNDYAVRISPIALSGYATFVYVARAKHDRVMAVVLPRRCVSWGTKNVTVEVNVVPHGDGGAPDLNGPPHGFKDG